MTYFDLTSRISELPTYQRLGEVQDDIEALKTPADFNPNNPDHLSAQSDRVSQRKSLSLSAARVAFRLEVAQQDEGFLPLPYRLGIIAAFDPEVIARQDRALKAAKSEDRAFQTMHARRSHILARRRMERTLFGMHDLTPVSPIHNAEVIGDQVTAWQEVTTRSSGERIAMRVSDEVALLGILPRAEVAFPVNEPTIENGVISYHVADYLDGIRHIKVASLLGEAPIIDNYPKLLHELRGRIIARPVLRRLHEALLTDTPSNIYYARLDVDADAIGVGEQAFHVIGNASRREEKRRYVPMRRVAKIPVRYK